MIKSEYTNRFTLLTNRVSNDATLAFYNLQPIINENLVLIGKDEVIEVAKVSMTMENLISLQNVINSCIEQYFAQSSVINQQDEDLGQNQNDKQI